MRAPVPRPLGPAGRLAVPLVVGGLWLLAVAARLGVPASIRPGLAAAAVVLGPGLAAWRALAPERPWDAAVDVPAAIVLGLATDAVALAVTFALRGSLGLTIGLVGAAAAVLAAVAAVRAPDIARGGSSRAALGVALPALALGWALGRVVTIDRDAPFHLGRVRKLAELPQLSVDGMSELVGGSTHAGYAFPLWHAVIAMSARLGDVDPTVAYRRDALLFVPLAALAWFAAARLLLDSDAIAAGAAGAAVALGLVGRPQPWTLLSDPPSATTQILFPALLACALLVVRSPSWAALATFGAAAAGVTLLHPTYLPFSLVVLGGGAVAGAAAARRAPWRPLAGAAAVLVLPFLVYSAWLLPLVRDTSSRVAAGATTQADIAQRIAEGHVVRVAGLLVPDPRRLAFSGLALVALCALPAAAALRRRRPAAWLLGGAAAVLVVELVPPFFDLLTQAFSVSQSRRLGAFLPRPLLLAAGAAGLAALAAPRGSGTRAPNDRRRLVAVPAAVLVVAVVLGVALRPTSRAALVIVLAAACGVALAAAWTIVRARREDPTSAAADLREGRVAALLLLALVLPAAIDLLPDAVADVRDPPAAERTLPPGLVAALRRLPDRAVVAADVETAYLVPAVSVALIYAGPPAHVANSRENDPYGRRAELNLMLSPRTAPERRRALLAEHEIGYVLLDRRLRSFSSLARRLPVEGGYRVRYRDGRYTLYAVGR